jgi:hypothetical protein
MYPVKQVLNFADLIAIAANGIKVEFSFEVNQFRSAGSLISEYRQISFFLIIRIRFFKDIIIISFFS